MLRAVCEAFSGEASDGRDEVEIVQAVWSLDASNVACDLVAVADGGSLVTCWHHWDGSMI
jgi:hypothetical protein